MKSLIVLASIGVLFSTVVVSMEAKGFKPINDLSNFNDLKPEYIEDNSYIAVACRNNEGNYSATHKLALNESFAPIHLNVFSQEYIKKSMPNHDIQIFQGERFGIAVISKKQSKKEATEKVKEESLSEPEIKKENNKK